MNSGSIPSRRYATKSPRAMNKSAVIAAKEIRDALRSNIFLIVLSLIGGLVIVSILMSTLVFRGQVDQYAQALESLAAIGKTPRGPAPELFPLTLLRGVVDYVEIIGALLGILLGYLSVAKEKNTRTFALILVRPVTKSQVVRGKLLGNALLIAGLMLAVGLVVWASLYFIGGVALSGTELLRLLLFVLLASAYLMVFFTLSFFLSLQRNDIVGGLVIGLLIWLAFVLILPQIGDTMDPDNQVPGGFFSAMTLTKPQEVQLMTKFGSYESARTGLEQLSITKHFERASFALFGIKKQYNGMPLGQVTAEQSYNIVFVLALLIVGIAADIVLFTRKRIL